MHESIASMNMSHSFTANLTHFKGASHSYVQTEVGISGIAGNIAGELNLPNWQLTTKLDSIGGLYITLVKPLY